MAAGSGGRFLPEDIAVQVEANLIQLWRADECGDLLAVMATQITQYPRRRALRCIGLVGARHWRWVNLFPEIERWAREEEGCDMMEAFYPSGLERVLPGDGWRVFHVLSERNL